jgi:hypothetical protein
LEAKLHAFTDAANPLFSKDKKAKIPMIKIVIAIRT